MPSIPTTESQGSERPAFDWLPPGLAEAVRFWEPRRLVYTSLLTVVLAGWVVGTWPHFLPAFTPLHLFQFAVLGLLANLCYCAAYLAEIVMQSAAPVTALPHLRSMLWVLGTLLAILLENYWIADEIYPYVK